MATKRLTRLGVTRFHTGDPAVPLDEPVDRHVVERQSAQVGHGPGQGNGKPGVIELPVSIEDRTFQPRNTDRRNAGLGSGPGDPPRAAQTQAAGQPVVEPET